MKSLVLATGNKGKQKELEDILEIPIEIADAGMDEVQSMDLEYVARRKAEEAFKIIRKPLIVDDVGVFIEAWNELPGPFVKYFYEIMGLKKILKMMENEKNRSVTVKCAVGYHDGNKVHVFTGEVKGVVAEKEKGTEGWGFDPIIIPKGYKETFAEMGFKKKNKISHRGKAFKKLKKYLDSKRK